MHELKLRDGEHLRVRTRGDGPALLLCHGFTGSGESWGAPLLEALAREHRLIVPDLIGHGGSSKPARAERYAVRAQLDDLCELLDACGAARATWLGYSMGGRLALAGTVHRSERVRALVLESSSPGLESDRERALRRDADERLAERLLREGVEAFIDHWLALPLFATQPEPERMRGRALRLHNDARALAASLRGFGTGAQPPLWSSLGRVRAPTRLISGSLDAKFSALAARMAERIPAAAHTSVPGAGHAVHLETPTRWLAQVREFRAGLPEEKPR